MKYYIDVITIAALKIGYKHHFFSGLVFFGIASLTLRFHIGKVGKQTLPVHLPQCGKAAGVYLAVSDKLSNIGRMIAGNLRSFRAPVFRFEPK